MLGWLQSLAVPPLSGAQWLGSWGQLPPAPRAREPRPRTWPPPRGAAGSGAPHSLLPVTSQQDGLRLSLRCGDWRAWLRCPRSPHFAERRLRLPLQPASGAGPGLSLPALPPSAPVPARPGQQKRWATQWSDSPLPLRAVGGRPGLEPGGLYAPGPVFPQPLAGQARCQTPDTQQLVEFSPRPLGRNLKPSQTE